MSLLQQLSLSRFALIGSDTQSHEHDVLMIPYTGLTASMSCDPGSGTFELEAGSFASGCRFRVSVVRVVCMVYAGSAYLVGGHSKLNI